MKVSKFVSIVASISLAVSTLPTFIFPKMEVSKANAQDYRTIEGRFRQVNDWGTRNGYVSCFPNFHQANYGRGVVFGAICLKGGGIKSESLYAVDLGYPQSHDQRFRAVNDWAGKNRWATGYPNFHQLDRGKGLFYGAILFPADAVVRMDIPAQELGFPNSSEERFRAINNWATRRGYAGAFPNFHQADYGQGVVFGAVLIKKQYGRSVDIPVSQLR
ncbi:hypothetical protein ACN4EE_06195 [Geminocystis sp. CENA526]|uniref:hypothetical protein n=1 Tax=Geminocystis sp. CENA526 TaxID=1355871 RepID=UPI003D6F199E